MLSGARWPINGRRYTFDNIVNIGEITRHLAIIEYLDWIPRQYRAGKKIRRHIGPTPWAVNREEPQSRSRQRIKARIGFSNQLATAFASRVERYRAIYRVVDTEWLFLIRSVYGRRGSV